MGWEMQLAYHSMIVESCKFRSNLPWVLSRSLKSHLLSFSMNENKKERKKKRKGNMTAPGMVEGKVYSGDEGEHQQGQGYLGESRAEQGGEWRLRAGNYRRVSVVTRLSIQDIPKQTEICQREMFQIPEERCPLSL